MSFLSRLLPFFCVIALSLPAAAAEDAVTTAPSAATTVDEEGAPEPAAPNDHDRAASPAVEQETASPPEADEGLSAVYVAAGLLAYGVIGFTAVLALSGLVLGASVSGLNPLFRVNVTGLTNPVEGARLQGTVGGSLMGVSAFGLLACFNATLLFTAGYLGGFEWVGAQLTDDE